LGRVNSLALKFALSLVMAGSFSTVFASSILPSCGTDTLSDYINNTVFPGGGCAIGVLDYYQFSYHTFNNPNDPLASNLLVSLSNQGLGFNFSQVNGQPITAAAGTTVQFEIDYDIVIDPAPVIPQGKLSIDPPSGDVTITQYFCNDVQYVFTNLCLGGIPLTLQVGTPETGLPQSRTITFVKPAATSQGIGLLFTLDGINGASSSFDGVDSTSTILYLDTPEPTTAASLLLGLLTLFGGYKLRKQRNPAK
jgi:hypothetical protein